MKEPNWIRILAILAGIVIAITLLRTVVALAAANAFYGSNDAFDVYVAATPVSDARVDEWLPAGTVLARDIDWSIGDAHGKASDEFVVFVESRITHGDELLFDGRVEIVTVSDPESWEHLGHTIRMPQLTVQENMHAVVQVSLRGLGEALETGVPGGSFWVDVVLASGAGEDEFRVVEVDENPEDFVNSGVPTLGRMLLGLAHPRDAAPDEGILYQTRGSGMLSHGKVDGGVSGAAVRESNARTNSSAYSHGLDVTVGGAGTGVKSSRLFSIHVDYSWNGNIW